jgi:hypothetical protein
MNATTISVGNTSSTGNVSLSRLHMPESACVTKQSHHYPARSGDAANSTLRTYCSNAPVHWQYITSVLCPMTASSGRSDSETLMLGPLVPRFRRVFDYVLIFAASKTIDRLLPGIWIPERRKKVPALPAKVGR